MKDTTKYSTYSNVKKLIRINFHFFFNNNKENHANNWLFKIFQILDILNSNFKKYCRSFISICHNYIIRRMHKNSLIVEEGFSELD